MTARAPRGQRGFTLIELMIALVVSSLLVGMILAIFMRMSLAYRGQQQVAGVQQVLASARAMIEHDAKQAGHMMPQGVQTAMNNLVKISPIGIVNSSTGPDIVRFFYADGSVQAKITTGAATWNVAHTVDDHTGFAVGDLVVIATTTGTTPNPTEPTGAPIILYDSCILRIASLGGSTSVTFETTPPFGTALNDHCIPATVNETMMYKAVARAYRIDPARPADGVLTMSPTGNQFGLNDWQDMAYGFTDLQVATQFFENGDVTDLGDPDIDPQRDWYSGAVQQTKTGSIARVPATNAFDPPLQMTISLVARTERNVEGIATAETPELRDPAQPDYNMIGDRAKVTFPTLDPALQGDRIYRYTTFTNDFRNMGVGR